MMKMNDHERSLCRAIDERQGELVELMQRLIRAKSYNPPGTEENVARVILPELERLGFKVQVVEVERGRPNIIATLSGEKDHPRLLYYGHMDTMPPGNPELWDVDPLGAEIIDGKIYGRGACDHKMPIAALIAAVDALNSEGVKLRESLVFVCVSDEEMGGTYGMKHLVERRMVKADWGVYGCTTCIPPEDLEYLPNLGTDNIIMALSAMKRYRITLRGKLTHGMFLEKGINAAEAAGALITALKERAEQVNRLEHPLTGRARMYVNAVQAGPKYPDVCDITVTRTLHPGEDPPQGKADVEEVVESFRAREPRIQTEITPVFDWPGAIVPRDAELIDSLRKAASKVTGREPTVTGIPSSSDMRWFVNDLNIPMVMFGYGYLMNHHAVNEHIAVEDLVNSAKAYALNITDMLG
ncbi:MAG: ArgE/DapE family deacylase [Deltaproteobacteria bacterium]|nr:ArgE/DapE family deacylase [Deltaproteobacteria bacterium]